MSMSLNLRGMDTRLIHRAKIRAAQLGLTLKQWVTSLIQRALSEPSSADPIDSHATIPPREPAVVESPLPPKGDS